MLKGEEVRSVSQQNVSPSAQGLEVKEISSPSGRGRSVSLDIPLYRTGHLVPYPKRSVGPNGDVTAKSVIRPNSRCGQFEEISIGIVKIEAGAPTLPQNCALYCNRIQP